MDRRKLLKACGAGALLWLSVGLYRTFPLPTRPQLLEGITIIELMHPEYDTTDRANAGLAVIRAGILLLRNGTIELYERDNLRAWNGSFAEGRVAENLYDVESFASDASGTLLFVSHSRLMQITPEGTTEKLAELSYFRLSLAPGYEPGSVLLFGGSSGQDGGVLLRATGGTGTGGWEGSVEALAVFEGKARAAWDASDGTYVALDSKIYQVVGSNQRLVFELSGQLAKRCKAELDAPERLVSLAMSEDEKTLFFSTQDNIYALRGAIATPIARDLGGILQFRDGILFVLDPNRQLLLGIENVADALKRAATS